MRSGSLTKRFHFSASSQAFHSPLISLFKPSLFNSFHIRDNSLESNLGDLDSLPVVKPQVEYQLA